MLCRIALGDPRPGPRASARLRENSAACEGSTNVRMLWPTMPAGGMPKRRSIAGHEYRQSPVGVRRCQNSEVVTPPVEVSTSRAKEGTAEDRPFSATTLNDRDELAIEPLFCICSPCDPWALLLEGVRWLRARKTDRLFSWPGR